VSIWFGQDPDRPLWFVEGARRGRMIFLADLVMLATVYCLRGWSDAFVFALGMLWFGVIGRVLG